MVSDSKNQLVSVELQPSTVRGILFRTVDSLGLSAVKQISQSPSLKKGEVNL